jgi:dienelactone hydrolase
MASVAIKDELSDASKSIETESRRERRRREIRIVIVPFGLMLLLCTKSRLHGREQAMLKWILAAFVVFTLYPGSVMASNGGEKITYVIDGQTYEGYYISPNSAAPLVLLIHDWDGLTDYEVQRANMLVEMGYAVFAADLFGAGVRPTELKDKRQHTGELYKDRDKMRALMQGALAAASSKGANTGNAVAMGYCFGGAAVLELARSGANLEGFATFHGGLKTPDGQDYTKTEGQILVMHGSADTAITMEQFAALANELEAAGVKHEMVTYGGAPHAFTVFGNERYREDADTKSWDTFSRFLRTTLQ